MGESTVITIRDGKETEIPSNQLSVEDIVKFKTGDRLSVDGFIIEGIAEIDESSITGRSEPIEKSKGNQVFSGAPRFTCCKNNYAVLGFSKIHHFSMFLSKNQLFGNAPIYLLISSL